MGLVFSFQFSDFSFQNLVFRFQISDFSFQNLVFRFQISDFRYEYITVIPLFRYSVIQLFRYSIDEKISPDTMRYVPAGFWPANGLFM